MTGSRMDSPDDDLAADEGLVQELGVVRVGWRVLVGPRALDVSTELVLLHITVLTTTLPRYSGSETLDTMSPWKNYSVSSCTVPQALSVTLNTYLGLIVVG